MTVETTYPGVYISEAKNQFSTVSSGATAVPVFAFTGNAAITATTRVADWLSFTQVAAPEGAEFELDKANLLHVSMKTYFDNGGGYCYVTPADRLADDVPVLDDVTMLVAAGVPFTDISDAVASLCTSGNTLFAVLDAPDAPLSADIMQALPSEQPYAAAYYPWLTSSWADSVPPSAAVAGMICKVDREVGPWKAPVNVTLQGALTPKFNVSDYEQGQYINGKAINMIRDVGRGATVRGARTLDADKAEWRYVPVRRLFNTVQKDVKRAITFSLFEPNSEPTWARVHAAISNYLFALWNRGGLLGERPEQAYFVQIGKDVTMTEDDIANGRMIVKIGLAALRPAEYIILQFTQDRVTA